MGTGIAIELQDADDEARLALEGSQEGDGKGKVDDKGGKGDEGKTDEEKAAEAELAERMKPVEKEDGSIETDEEAKTRVEAEDAAAAEPTEVQKLTSEVRDLRQMLRTSKRELTQMGAKFERLSKKPAAVTSSEEGEEELDEDGKSIVKKKDEEPPLSRVEELQEAIVQIGATKGASLDILLETMEQNEKYKDVREVCSRANFDDIFEAIASEAVKEKGGNADEVLLEVEFNTWNRANPYSYMYDLIKKYHPDFVKAAALPGKKDEKKTPAKAPGSIGNLGGDSDIKSGWTAKRIDDLPEAELSTVPVETYDKYMRGELA